MKTQLYKTAWCQLCVLCGASMAPPTHKPASTCDQPDLQLHNPNPVDLCPQTPRELAHNIAALAPYCCCHLITPLGRATPCHNYDGTYCTVPGGTSLVTMSFIIQSNHRSTCSYGWKDGLGCSCFSLTRSLRLPFCVSVVLHVSHAVSCFRDCLYCGLGFRECFCCGKLF